MRVFEEEVKEDDRFAHAARKLRDSE